MPRGGPFTERIPIDIRFWSKVQKTDTCWLWTAFINPDGYGIFGIGSRADGSRRTIGAHRWIYERMNGNIPKGVEIDHLCRTRNCVRPDHLEAVTHKVNMERGDLSNNGAQFRARTHCPQGHEYSPENTYVRGASRKCRTCDRFRQRARRRGKHYP